MSPLVVLLTGLSCTFAAEFSTTQSFKVKVGKTTKYASCDITISFDGSVVSEDDSSVSCTLQWAKSSSLNFAKTLTYNLGDTSADLFTAELSITLKKAKNKPASKLTTTVNSITNIAALTPDAEFNPGTLWCPQEDYMIWGQGPYSSVVGEVVADGYESCAEQCSQSDLCFSWTMNSNSGDAFGLAGNTCRLLAYMNVSGIAYPGVQSGYHKCWAAAQTLEP